MLSYSNAAMPTLEQVSKRLFSDTNWILKCLVGAVLLAVPVAHFFACGFIYEMIDRVRRGEEPELPEWEDWRRLFVHGVAAFALFLVFTVAPLGVAWLLTWFLRPFGAGYFGYTPLIPAALLCLPTTVASLYLYQRREDFRDALQVWVLLRMLRVSWPWLVTPTLALIGLLVCGLPFMTFTVFAGFVVWGACYAAIFRHLEIARRAGAPRRA